MEKGGGAVYTHSCINNIKKRYNIFFLVAVISPVDTPSKIERAMEERH